MRCDEFHMHVEQPLGYPLKYIGVNQNYHTKKHPKIIVILLFTNKLISDQTSHDNVNQPCIQVESVTSINCKK
jgi:hypothetical protein